MSGRNKKPILYIKPGCPWCREALTFFQRHGVDLDIRDVESNAQDMSAMISLSGQTMTPTFVYEDFIVADFSVDEFNAELNEFPEMRRSLGIGHGED
jgi:glutaredoxin